MGKSLINTSPGSCRKFNNRAKNFLPSENLPATGVPDALGPAISGATHDSAQGADQVVCLALARIREKTVRTSISIGFSMELSIGFFAESRKSPASVVLPNT